MNDIEIVLPSVPQRLIYADSRLLAVLKIAGEICEGKTSESLPVIFAKEAADTLVAPFFLECPNRLDKPVSGIQVIARDVEALSFLSEQFAQHKVQKTYWAVVEGVIEKGMGEWIELSHYLSFNPSKKRATVTDTEHRKSKKVSLEYRIIGNGNNYSYLEVKPKTGRTHQIRSQLASAGLHIKGDVKYGGRRSDTLPGIRLHCASMNIIHPETKKEVSFSAPVPFADPLWESFMDSLEMLSGR
ncbi:MAG TPA: RluA family pseudouridine synthase [Treponemataceae bacterium]|jgi:23S rRNA pseudouridine1911/1915/1917 synthase|nr:RluA family pseudouridine synthase [Treponemataceae bacterium]